jgi:uncharacterized cupredoxin-like copper-binding protein
MRHVARTLALLAALSLWAVACSPGEPEITPEEQVAGEDRPEDAEDATDEPAPAGETVRFVAVDIDYSEAPTEVAAGEVTFELVNEGALEHNVVLEEPGDVLVVEAMGGETATGDVSLEAGSYTYYCSIPGHREAGMEGTFEVSA